MKIIQAWKYPTVVIDENWKLFSCKFLFFYILYINKSKKIYRSEWSRRSHTKTYSLAGSHVISISRDQHSEHFESIIITKSEDFIDHKFLDQHNRMMDKSFSSLFLINLFFSDSHVK